MMHKVTCEQIVQPYEEYLFSKFKSFWPILANCWEVKLHTEHFLAGDFLFEPGTAGNFLM